MIINAHTKIAAILKYRPDALEAIIGISPGFAKLRNPLLRKLVAGRTTLAMASKIGGCSVADFYDKLHPLGFIIDSKPLRLPVDNKGLPGFVISLKAGDTIELDVRPIITAGKDPLILILEKINAIKAGQALKIINSFEPAPLIVLLEKRGFDSYTDKINEQLTETYFYKKSGTSTSGIAIPAEVSAGWEEVMLQYKDHIQTIDVRGLEMPQPMLRILEALENLSPATALFVHHKRIPVFLLPELADRKFGYRIKEISDSEVNLLIFKS